MNIQPTHIEFLHVEDEKEDRDAVASIFSTVNDVILKQCQRPGHIPDFASSPIAVAIVDLHFDGELRDDYVTGIVRKTLKGRPFIVLSNYVDSAQGSGAFAALSKRDFRENPDRLLQLVAAALRSISNPFDDIDIGGDPVTQLHAAINSWKRNVNYASGTALVVSFMRWLVKNQTGYSVFSVGLISLIVGFAGFSFFGISTLGIMILISGFAIAAQAIAAIVGVAKSQLRRRIFKPLLHHKV